MNTTMVALLILYSAVPLVWVLRLAYVMLLMRRVPRLRRNDPAITPSAKGHVPGAPLVSVLIPCKDEEATIAQCLRSVLSQSYSQLEVIVVDDRSRDRTAELVREFAVQDSRVRLIQATELPDGWTGKTHALWLAAQAARGEWFWFIDSDTWHAPENLGVVLRHVEATRSDLVTLLPGLESETFWERVVQPLAAVVLMKLYDVLRLGGSGTGPSANLVGVGVSPGLGQDQEGFANGQYLLIRRGAYEAVGGHEAVRGEFLEDVALGRFVQARGGNVSVAFGTELTRARMYSSLGQIVAGWGRILYGASRGRARRLVISLVGLTAFSSSAFAILAGWLGAWLAGVGNGGTWLPALALVNLAHLALLVTTMCQAYKLTGSQRRWLAFYPLACVVTSWILFRAARMCLTHEVAWRGRVYRRVDARAPAASEPHGSTATTAEPRPMIRHQ